jgi:hypothetical protein
VLTCMAKAVIYGGKGGVNELLRAFRKTCKPRAKFEK